MLVHIPFLRESRSLETQNRTFIQNFGNSPKMVFQQALDSKFSKEEEIYIAHNVFAFTKTAASR